MKLKLPNGTWHITFRRKGSKCMEPTSDGECDRQDKKGRKRIYIRKGMGRKERMETLLHEMLHAGLPQASEEWVELFARKATKVLRRHGHK